MRRGGGGGGGGGIGGFMYFIKSLISVLFSNGLVVMMGIHSCCGVQSRRF